MTRFSLATLLLVAAPLTVKKAYDELERAGVIRMARGQGSFISTKAQELDSGAKLERLRPAVKRLLHEALLLGVDMRSVRRLFAEESATLKGAQASESFELKTKKG